MGAAGGGWYGFVLRDECSVTETHGGCGGMSWTVWVENSTEDQVASGVDSEI